MPAPAKPKKCEEGAPDWLTTWGDMVTLLLTFFVFLVANMEPKSGEDLKMVLAAFQGLGAMQGGNTMSSGKLAELGNTIMSLPSMERGKALDRARKKAISEFQPEIKSQKVRVTEDERGVVISLSGDAFFEPASADVKIEDTRMLLQKVARFLTDPDLGTRKFRIEGHTDDVPTDPRSAYPSNWELSTARATNVLHYLVDFGVNENQFQVAGLAHTVPLANNDTAEGRAYNRRVDIVVLSEGNY